MNTSALQLHRAHCVRQAHFCDREAYEAEVKGEWAGHALLTSCADLYRREAINASMALRVVHRVMQ